MGASAVREPLMPRSLIHASEAMPGYESRLIAQNVIFPTLRVAILTFDAGFGLSSGAACEER